MDIVANITSYKFFTKKCDKIFEKNAIQFSKNPYKNTIFHYKSYLYTIKND